MADRTLLFTTDAGNEINAVQTLEPRIAQADALGASTLVETDVRTLAKDKDGNLVANPVLTDMLNTEFVNVIRRGMDGKAMNDSWVTFATTSNDENGGVDPEKSLLVSLNDLMLSIMVPEDVGSVTTEPIESGDPLCKYYGKPIRLDQVETDEQNEDDNDDDQNDDEEDDEENQNEQEKLWSLIYDRTVRLHKNNGQSVSGKWSLDMERINKQTPDVLFLHVDEEHHQLAIDLDPSKQQAIPVIFTPDDGQDQFKLLLFIKPYDLREELKQMKLSNSTAEPAEAQFLRPWVIVSTVNATTLTGAKGEGGLLKVAGLTNCVKAVDALTGGAALQDVTVSVIPTHAGFNNTGTLDAVKLPSVPAEYSSVSQLENLVENGEYTVKAVVSKAGYESQTVDLAVCINAEDQRNTRLTIVLGSEALSLSRTLVNGEANTGEVSCTSRHNESDAVVDSNLAIPANSISGLDGETTKAVTATVVNELGATQTVIYVKQGESGEPSAYILVKCECSGYVTEIIKLPVAVVDKRLPDGVTKWSVTWAENNPMVIIPNSVAGYKGDALENVVVSSLGKADALVASCNATKLTDQWGNEVNVSNVVVGVVPPLNKETTFDVIDIPEGASDTTDNKGNDDPGDDEVIQGVGCWLNVSILTAEGQIVVKKVTSSVTDNRATT